MAPGAALHWHIGGKQVSMLRTIFFDVDGTLLDDDANWRSAVAATAGLIVDRYPPLGREELTSAYFDAATEIWRTIRDAQEAPWGNMDDPGIVRKVWHSALTGLSASSADSSEHAAHAYARFRLARVSVFNDVMGCLAILEDKYRLGVITNGSDATHLPKIAAAGLDRYFESVTTTDCGAGKPLPAIFNHALAALDAEPASSAYVGDSLHWDISGANQVGIFSIWLNRAGTQRASRDPVPRAEIASLHELPELLSRADP